MGLMKSECGASSSYVISARYTRSQLDGWWSTCQPTSAVGLIDFTRVYIAAQIGHICGIAIYVATTHWRSRPIGPRDAPSQRSAVVRIRLRSCAVARHVTVQLYAQVSM